MIDFKFIGWNKTAGHDKIWAAFEIEGRIYAAWGKRGAKLQFKDHGSVLTWGCPSTVQLLINKKILSGYEPIDSFLMFSIFPYFEEKVESELVLKTLIGKVK